MIFLLVHRLTGSYRKSGTGGKTVCATVDRTPQSQICFNADFRCAKREKGASISIRAGTPPARFPSGEIMGDKKAKPATPAAKPTKKK
ncbi:MAG: hypothetical protein LJE62_14140 [Silicimonas sp.]|jgi:hypothetical protein|nr:hypothetical protein [Silicimonas sp.]